MGSCTSARQDRPRNKTKQSEQKTEANIKIEQPQPQRNSLNSPEPRNEPPINLVYAERPQISTNQPRRQQTNSRISIPQQMRVQTVEQASEVDQISSTISQLQRGRARRQPSIIQEQNPESQQISQLQLLFFLFRAIRRQDLSQEENALLFFRLLALLEAEPQAQGLTKQQIDKLQIRESTNSEENCPVCQDTIQKNQKIMGLPCHHFFHPDCIVPWLEKSSKCPVCRGSASQAN